MSMEAIAATVITVLGTVGAFGKFLVMDRIKDLKDTVARLDALVDRMAVKLDECKEEHALAREEVAGLKAEIEAIKRHQPLVVQAEANAASDVAKGGSGAPR
jgi:chromosome condensin MukBEF ATPase and DNA-binding subunit MukB